MADQYPSLELPISTKDPTLSTDVSAAEEESSADAVRAAVAELTKQRSRGLNIAEARASEKAHLPRRSFESQKKGNAVAVRRQASRDAWSGRPSKRRVVPTRTYTNFQRGKTATIPDLTRAPKVARGEDERTNFSVCNRHMHLLITKRRPKPSPTPLLTEADRTNEQLMHNHATRSGQAK